MTTFEDQLTNALDGRAATVAIDDRLDEFLRADPAMETATGVARRDEGDGSRRHRLGLAAAVVMLVAGLVAALAVINHDDRPTGSAAPSPHTDAPVGDFVWPIGDFVWPVPARGFATLHDLTVSFTAEVLHWDADDTTLIGDVEAGAVESRNQPVGPQAFSIENDRVGGRVDLIAAPGREGWGFVQIGDALSATTSDVNGEPVELEYTSAERAMSSSVEIRLANGSTTTITVVTGGDGGRVPVSVPTTLADIVSALIVEFDTDGNAISAAGGTFSTSPAQEPLNSLPGSVPPGATTTPSGITASTLAVVDGGVPYGPLDYATTARPLPLWPDANASDPAATTSGYGMDQCDSGWATRLLRVDPAHGASHAYSGTLCVFIDLAEPRVDAVTMCATTSVDTITYARCQRRTDETDTSGPGTAVVAVADSDQVAAMTAFPTPTIRDQSELFTVEIAATRGTPGEADVRDARGAVILDAVASDVGLIDAPGVCFTIEVVGATATGCAGHDLLATGLAYGAFQHGDNPIQIVGIVPDEVTTITINGDALTPVDNVWQFTASGHEPLVISVASADGRTATTTAQL